MKEFLFILIFFRRCGEGAGSGGGFAGVNEGGVVGGRGDVIWVVEPVTDEYSVELEGV